MSMRFELGDIVADVTHKEIKNIHLSVNPPMGDVRISAPMHINQESIRLFVLSKLSWIRKQQQKFREQARETPREYIDRESHYVWGKRYLMRVVEKSAPSIVEIKHDKIILQVKPDSTKLKHQEMLESWYRQELRTKSTELMELWQKKLNVSPNRLVIQKMKTKWGSCSQKSGIIRLNLELAKKPVQYLEYVIVHELVHLIEPTHNQKFVGLMDMYIPKWRHYKEELNRLPIQQEEW